MEEERLSHFKYCLSYFKCTNFSYFKRYNACSIGNHKFSSAKLTNQHLLRFRSRHTLHIDLKNKFKHVILGT